MRYYNGSFCLIRPPYLSTVLNICTGKDIKIAVIDSGWDYNKFLDDRIVKGISFIDDSDGFRLSVNDNITDNLGHGTVCTDIILQIACDAIIYPIKVFNKKLETNIEVLVQAIEYCISIKVEIINLSLGTRLEEALRPLYIVCEKAKNEGIIIVSANSNDDINSYPAMFENVISVRAGEMKGKFNYEYYSDEVCECIANGYPTDALTIGGKRIKASGNSYAAPIITGIIALLKHNSDCLDLISVRHQLKKYSINN
ncbi:MAG: S8 family serine peptidase [Ignavibacteriales bacterium]|nr:S8 family serine peptidase [Ignavibacteriales bacterium]